MRWDAAASTWTTDLGGAPADVVALLERSDAGARGKRPAPAGVALEPSGLPFEPTSLRGVMVNEEHYVRGAHTMVRHFMPSPVSAFVHGWRSVTRRPFPALRPPSRFYEEPAFYMGNHVAMVADGAVVRFPKSCEFRDFELELAAIVTREWDTATQGAPTAADVIGAFTVVNDFSARDLQWADERRGAFSGIVKAKSFATGMAATVVTADEILPVVGAVRGRVSVNGETWCEGTTGGGVFDLDAIVAHVARDERLVPGEVLSLGTLAGCCGLELDRFLQPGDTVRLELDGVGTLTNTVAA